MNQLRKECVALLVPFIKHDKNVLLVEKYLYIYSRTDEEYLNLMYQCVGNILVGLVEKKPKKQLIEELLVFVHQMNLEWNHPVFQEYAKMEREEIDFQTNPFSVEDGVLQCYKCKSYRTFSFQRQTRSADEGATSFSTCANCGNKWRTSN